MRDIDDVVFPCERIPEDPGKARLLGLYPQRQDGRWMQRVKILGGVATADQWRALGAIAREFTPGTPLHLTTRQEIELHDLTAERVPAVQKRLAEADLNGRGACGDTLRNVTVCPCSGALAGVPDLLPLAWAVRRTLETESGICSLPRKFKVSLSACEDACGQPWINDLGLVARKRRGRWGFTVTVAGSLGARPGTGMKLFDWMDAEDVLPLAVAALRFFAAHGDRKVRTRARLRHVRERLGDQTFTRMLLEAFEGVKADREWPEVPMIEPSDGYGERLTLTFPNGDVSPEVAGALAELAEEPDTRVRIGIEHQVIVFGRDECVLEPAVQRREVLVCAMELQSSVVACPGSRWCHRGLVDTNTLAERLRRELDEIPASNSTVCISGCPNGCAHSRVAEVGLVGRRVRTAGGSADAFDLYAGGGRGMDDPIAERVAERLSPDEVVREVRRLGSRQ